MRERRTTNAEDDWLPITDWEVPEARKTIPEDLRLLIGAPTRIVRVPQHVHEKIITKHARDLAVYERFNELILAWELYRKNRDRWEIYLSADEAGDRIVVVIGADKSGSYNLVTFYAVRSRNLRNRNLLPKQQRED